MKVTIILGTRPEIIKMAPVVWELEKRKNDFFILHTGQHYSYNLDRVFFEQLRLPQPKYNLKVGSGTHAQETAKILVGVEEVLQQEIPDIVLVEGDTNSVLGSALAASKLHIKVGHVEAGLRSYDRNMPEETNRILTDHCSDYLFAPTEKARAILLGEGIPRERIFMTGNTIVDALLKSLEIAGSQTTTLKKLGLCPKEYFLVTVHRQENVDNIDRFSGILEGLRRVSEKFQIPVIYAIHPRSKKRMEEFGLRSDGIRLIEPQGFLDFLRLEAGARLVLTDSGGIQEESCILKVPCVTLRDNTERPETLEVGSNLMAGTSPDEILDCAMIMLGRENDWQNPFGDGKAGVRIAEIILGAT